MKKCSVYKFANEKGFSIRKGNRHIYANGVIAVVKDDKGNPVKGYSIYDYRTGCNILACQDSNRDNLLSWENVLEFFDLKQ